MKSVVRRAMTPPPINPVGLALMRRNLAEAIVDQKIAIYMYQRGDKCTYMLSGAIVIFGVALRACQLAELDTLEVRILRGAWSACSRLQDADYYDPDQAPALAHGLDKVLELHKLAGGKNVRAAYKELIK